MVITTVPAADTVYVPTEPAHLLTEATTAIRAWTDELLQITAEGLSAVINPPAQVRTRAYRGLLVADHSAEIERRLVELDVDPSRCAVASATAVDEATAWPTWQRLLPYLVDHGHDGSLVEEVVSPVSFHEAGMRVNASSVTSYIRALEPALLADIVTYFRQPGLTYWQSWRPLTAVLDGSESVWEVVIPSDGLRSPLSSDPLR